MIDDIDFKIEKIDMAFDNVAKSKHLPVSATSSSSKVNSHCWKTESTNCYYERLVYVGFITTILLNY